MKEEKSIETPEMAELPAPSGSQELRIAFTKEELIQKAKAHLKGGRNLRDLAESERIRYYRDLGLWADFIYDLFANA
jgi:hypothetical protein